MTATSIKSSFKMTEASLDLLNYGIPKLLLATENFKGHTLVQWDISESTADFGFMSSIYQAKLSTVSGERDYCFDFIVKVMKGSEDFRQNSQSYLQFQNEIFMYEKVLPYFNSYLNEKRMECDLRRWSPITYLSNYINIGESIETILIQENLQKSDFFIETDLYLTKNHFDIMIECIAQFHAVSLALKIENSQKLSNIVDEIKPLCFEQPNGLSSLYDVLHEISTDRLFRNVFSKRNEYNHQFIRDIERLKEIVGEKPVKLLDRFRRIDEFAVIGHGDYHRNNVMFKKVNHQIVTMKMIDFQQIRFGSPCLDLSFFMYLNISCDLRDLLWDQLLQKYHDRLIKHTADILKISQQDTVFECYSYEKFIQHCQRFFLYGALISASFTPWLLTTREETHKVASLFQRNMFDPEYRKFALMVGGEIANEKVVRNMIHASEMGYMKVLYE